MLNTVFNNNSCNFEKDKDRLLDKEALDDEFLRVDEKIGFIGKIINYDS